LPLKSAMRRSLASIARPYNGGAGKDKVVAKR
jgi:hypothetical protein